MPSQPTLGELGNPLPWKSIPRRSGTPRLSPCSNKSIFDSWALNSTLLLSSTAGRQILRRKEPIAPSSLQESRSRHCHGGLEQSRKKNAKLIDETETKKLATS